MNSATIEDVTEFVLDGTHGSPSRTETGIPVLSAQNVKDGTLDYDTDRYTSASEHAAFAQRLPLRAGDVLLTIVGTIGRAAVLEDVRPLVLQRSVAVFRPREELLCPKFLYHVSQSRAFQSQLSRASNQSSQAGVYLGKLKKLRIPLPPLPEQRRIADILDKADVLRAKRRAAIRKLDELIQSIFLDMFGDPATNPKGWPIELIEDVAQIMSGATPRTEKPEFWDGTIKWVTPKELSDLEGIYVVETERHITEAGLQSCAATVLPTGSVLFSSRAPIGHTAICAAPMATNQGFKSFIPRTDRLDAHYLLQWLRLRRSFLEGLGTGATFKEVSKTVVARVQIPVPPLAQQTAFADRMRKIQRLSAEGRNAKALLDEQYAGLQYHAFRAEL